MINIKPTTILSLLFLLLVHYNSFGQASLYEVKCNDKTCEGSYMGAEFIDGDDIAHQLSNAISGAVGNQLKRFYSENNYVKVDLPNIKMTTAGMGSGKVHYTISIPFVSVENKCDAYTSFDHSGGWNHTPELNSRKKSLSNALIPGEELDISELHQTKEGLQEYWIQWKNKNVQENCAK